MKRNNISIALAAVGKRGGADRQCVIHPKNHKRINRS